MDKPIATQKVSGKILTSETSHKKPHELVIGRCQCGHFCGWFCCWPLLFQDWPLIDWHHSPARLRGPETSS